MTVFVSHQVKVVKYLRGFVHLSHGDQDLIVNVLLEGSHVETYSGLQSRVHLQYSSKGKLNLSRHTLDHSFSYFF